MEQTPLWQGPILLELPYLLWIERCHRAPLIEKLANEPILSLGRQANKKAFRVQVWGRGF